MSHRPGGLVVPVSTTNRLFRELLSRVCGHLAEHEGGTFTIVICDGVTLSLGVGALGDEAGGTEEV